MYTFLSAHALWERSNLEPGSYGVLGKRARGVAQHDLPDLEWRERGGCGRRGGQLGDGTDEAAAESEGQRARVEP